MQVIKKLLLTIIMLLFVSTTNSYSETLDVTVDNKTYTLTIPDNYLDIRSAYIDISKIYIQAENDNTDFIQITEELKTIIADLTKKVDDSIVLLEKKIEIPLFQSMILFNIGYDFYNQIICGDMQYQVLIYDKMIVGIKTGYPFNLAFIAGWKF